MAKKKADNGLWRDMILANTIASLKDESYTYIVKRAEEFLKDPEVREEINYLADRFILAIAKGVLKLQAKERKKRKSNGF